MTRAREFLEEARCFAWGRRPSINWPCRVTVEPVFKSTDCCMAKLARRITHVPSRHTCTSSLGPLAPTYSCDQVTTPFWRPLARDPRAPALGLKEGGKSRCEIDADCVGTTLSARTVTNIRHKPWAQVRYLPQPPSPYRSWASLNHSGRGITIEPP